MTADELESEFASLALRPFVAPGVLLLGADDALRYIARARVALLPVLGIDCFILEGPRTIATLNHIADFSSAAESGDGSWEAATEFVEERRNQRLAFEVVLGEPAP